MPAAAAAAIIVVLSAGLVVAIAWGVTLSSRLEAVERSPAATPAPGSPAGTPSSDATPKGTTSPPTPAPLPSGAPQVEGGVWYPPTAGESSIVIAAAGASSQAQARADIVVSDAADDEINEALRELSFVGGGQVLLLEGRYELDNPIVMDGHGLALVGVNVGNGVGYSQGAIGSQIVPSERFPQDEFLLRAPANAYGPLISLLQLDGLFRAQGLSVEGSRPTVTLNVVTQATGAGMRFAGGGTGNRPYDGYILFNRVFDGTGIGILNDEFSGDMLIEGNIVFRNDGDGFRCLGASQMYRVNHAYNNGGMGLRIIPGCVRTRLSSNKWEGNAEGGVSIEGGSGFTIVGDTFAHNESGETSAGAHVQLGVRGESDTIGVMLWGLSFGKGDDDNPHLVHVGPRAREVHLGPLHSNGGSSAEPVRVDDGGEVTFHEAVPDPVVD